MNKSCSEHFEDLRNEVEAALKCCFLADVPQQGLADAMRYSLLAGGKRLRPVLLLAFCEASGGNVQSALPAACGVEMLHTYSLIHDDLPCMDNDDLRRGKPTCHKVYGETNAVLAGDALQAAAFSAVLRADTTPAALVEMLRTFADAVGLDGMCGGQFLDMLPASGKQVDDLAYLNSLKTGALLKACCVMGVQCAGGSLYQQEAAASYAENLGLAFQIRDDVLDAVSTTEILGKPTGSDEEQNKLTYYSLYGEKRCGELVEEYTLRACETLQGTFENPGFLTWLAQSLADRAS